MLIIISISCHILLFFFLLQQQKKRLQRIKVKNEFFPFIAKFDNSKILLVMNPIQIPVERSNIKKAANGFASIKLHFLFRNLSQRVIPKMAMWSFILFLICLLRELMIGKIGIYKVRKFIVRSFFQKSHKTKQKNKYFNSSMVKLFSYFSQFLYRCFGIKIL